MSPNSISTIFVIGGTGAQGIPVVRDLVADQKYSVRVLSRDPASRRAKALLALGNVSIVEGSFADEAVLRQGLRGCQGAFRAAFPHISKANGYLLATSSMAAFVHNPLQGAYPASKAGVWALCDTWRLEVRHTGVAVGSLHPTFFKTPMFDAIHANPAINRLRNGNSKGIWKMADIDVVVRRTVRGIERRSAHIVAPRSLAISALAPGLAQAVVERIGLRGSTIPDAIALSQLQRVNAATGIRKANR